jgi:isoleucyl-tRNA synthetase
MRWLFFSGQAPWTSIRFQETAIAEGQREFLIRLYNVYSFFVIYANIDKWLPAGRPHGQGSTLAHATQATQSELDRWVLSELHRTVRDVRASMDAYDNFTAARRLNEFVDGLSNWYVRRSRERFWRAGMDADKQAAYGVLYECLVTTTKLIAPFTPFLAESLHQNLVRSQDSGGALSVHLCDYPSADESLINEDLSEEMAIVRDIISLGRAARAEAKIKVRQPLALVEIVLADRTHSEWLRSHEALIADELNVKRVEFTAEADHYVTYQIKPNFKSIGPKFGKLGQAIKAALAAAKDPAGMRRSLDSAGRVGFSVDGQSVELTPEDVQIELTAKPGWAAAQGRTAVVVLKTELTDELRAECMARELVHHVQQKRKDLNLRYEQRIDLAIVGDEGVQRVVKAFAEYIMSETLAQSLLSQGIAGVEGTGVELEGHAATVFVRPM